MRVFFIVSCLLVVTLARPFPKVETIEVEGLGKVSITKLLRTAFPNSAEVPLFEAIIDTPDEEGLILDEILKVHHSSRDLDKIFGVLKLKNAVLWAKLEPHYQKNKEAFDSLQGDAKAFMAQYFTYAWENLIEAIKSKNPKKEMLQIKQGENLKEKFDAMSADLQKSVKEKFPMFTYFITAEIYKQD